MWELSTTWAVASVAWWVGLAGILEYFHVSWEAMLIFTALLVLDFALGISDAYVQDRNSVTSKAAWRWIFKKFTKFLLPLIVILVLRWVWFDNLDLVQTTIMSILIITEGYSVVGHIYSINAWKQIPEIDAMSYLIEFILWIFKKKLPAEANKEEKEEDKVEE